MALVADGHRQLHAVMPNLSGIDIGLRRHDVVKWCQAKPPAGQQDRSLWAFRRRKIEILLC
jgi:hypothetical protein